MLVWPRQNLGTDLAVSLGCRLRERDWAPGSRWAFPSRARSALPCSTALAAMKRRSAPAGGPALGRATRGLTRVWVLALWSARAQPCGPKCRRLKLRGDVVSLVSKSAESPTSPPPSGVLLLHRVHREACAPEPLGILSACQKMLVPGILSWAPSRPTGHPVLQGREGANPSSGQKLRARGL